MVVENDSCDVCMCVFFVCVCRVKKNDSGSQSKSFVDTQVSLMCVKDEWKYNVNAPNSTHVTFH